MYMIPIKDIHWLINMSQFIFVLVSVYSKELETNSLIQLFKIK